MKLRRALTVVGMCLAMTGISGAAAPAASAGQWWDHEMYTDDDNPGGRVRFKAYGDIVELCDIQADGYGVELRITSRKLGVTGYTIVDGGDAGCADYRASDGKPYDLTEEAHFESVIYLQGCSCVSRDSAQWCNG